MRWQVVGDEAYEVGGAGVGEAAERRQGIDGALGFVDDAEEGGEVPIAVVVRGMGWCDV